jgi:CO/xanthine dehydrogenase Mo-binding subunit
MRSARAPSPRLKLTAAPAIWARKFTVAHDCGLIINPDGLKRCIERNVVQGTSRALSEEVAFDCAKVTSID